MMGGGGGVCLAAVATYVSHITVAPVISIGHFCVTLGKLNVSLSAFILSTTNRNQCSACHILDNNHATMDYLVGHACLPHMSS